MTRARQERPAVARRVIAQRFLSLDRPGRLFVNIAHDMLVSEARPSRHARLPIGLEDVPPDRLVIELTESSTATSFEKLVAVLDRLRAPDRRSGSDTTSFATRRRSLP